MLYKLSITKLLFSNVSDKYPRRFISASEATNEAGQ